MRARAKSKKWVGLSCLGLAAAALGDIATTATGSKTSTAVTLEATTALAAGAVTAAAAGTTATSPVAVATVRVAAGAALLKQDLLAADLVGVGGNGGSVARRLVVLNEGAVLN